MNTHIKFNWNKDKTTHAILLILDRLGGKSDFHKVFKILYFADQKHLVEFGRPITGDYYIAMKHGPVPSISFDILKSLRGDGIGQIAGFDAFFEVQGNNTVIAKHQPDLEELSGSNIEYLLDAIEENRNLSFNELSTKSHQTAWEKAIEDDEMSIIDIAIEGGANGEMLKYIALNLNNQTSPHYAIR